MSASAMNLVWGVHQLSRSCRRVRPDITLATVLRLLIPFKNKDLYATARITAVGTDPEAHGTAYSARSRDPDSDQLRPRPVSGVTGGEPRVFGSRCDVRRIVSTTCKAIRRSQGIDSQSTRRSRE